MMFPPMLLRVKIDQPERGLSLWIPLFIIMPVLGVIALVLFIITLPFVLLIYLFTGRFRWLGVMFKAIPVLSRCLFALRGLKVDVNGENERVFISFV